MSFLIRSTFKRTPRVSSRILPRALYHPEIHTTKRDEFFITASYPDDFESPTLITKRSTSGTPEWDEINATLSEADIKADRGEAYKKGRPDDVFQPEADLEPKIDEL
ncbi:hypothetical protein P175DRAFT_0543480 [Aspergillus ochraceoroseus IBT 24754]|uniref:Uncharacterized protein n=3 Tax=Aspergillus subgen. Nidulantes TaxID=2720870 RepID=A0A0F8UQ55_9EURO|nr:uncharacterized protein P175DRAFT_0543480 [Aspergillus ochraceoroseus IBT 24754]KKK12981.1 hypothetical protein ARAM_000928 [Aspergillus rambellii]KKK21973.1 hypothetical protein AOCH_001869 [Aspergillus ochraceoroseus]PTU23251.1 hypothetical protein P175DRAFT_0543480 [Aspergillus ochraceoroseus IBT 24754]